MKRALVTGGSGAIGSAICRALAKQGMFVYVHAHSNVQKAEAVAEGIRADGGQAESVSFNVADAEAVSQQLTRLLEQGPIQVVVNNAGIHDDAPMAGMSQQQWRSVVDISLNGFFNVTQPLLLPMMSCRWGRIVSISSVAALTGNRGQANYAAAKSGLLGASKSLAIEMGSRGITANVVAPGIIESDMSQDLFDKATIKQLVPVNRVGTPEEVASLVAFLCSEQAGYISGQDIHINGGMA